MRKRLRKALSSIFLLLALILCTPTSVFADDSYEVYLDDLADLLSSEEEELLAELMFTISEYGNVAFVSLVENPNDSTEAYAQWYYNEVFGTDSGILFLIDMDERMIWIETDGEIKETISPSYALTITDNTYSYATDGDYYLCAQTAFEQSLSLLEDRSIAQPMKYLSNALLALTIAFLFNYFLSMALSSTFKASEQELLSGTTKKIKVFNTRTNFLYQTKKYSPQSSGSGSSGGSSSSSGGGGGHRSSGGGHRF